MNDRRYEAELLLIDDDRELCQLLEQYLASEHMKVECVTDGELGIDLARFNRHDAVILDVMLPGINGFEVLRRIRAHSDVPVIILTARGEEVDRVVGFEIGADDYVSKPFSPRELAARIRAILRRANHKETEQVSTKIHKKIAVGNICLDPGSRTVTRSGRPVELTSVEFGLLEILLHSAGRVVTRDQLCKEVLDRDLSPIDRSVDMHVSRLRKKLGAEGSSHDNIKTIRGVGYLYTQGALRTGISQTAAAAESLDAIEE
jgi:two-component system response regulator CpxR